MNKRYFIVFFITKNGDALSYLHSSFTTFSRKYLNKKVIYNQLKKELGENLQFSITNIIELTYEEYKTWEV